MNEIKKQYLDGQSIAFIARQHQSTKGIVQRKLIKIGCWRKGKLPTARRKSKYVYNENFFNIIENEATAYWLGFIAADGNITIDSHKRHYLRIKLKQSDAGHLLKLSQSLEANYPITTAGESKSQKPYCQLVVCGKKIVTALIKHGITPRKTSTLLWPEIPEKLQSHFCRGYFDGDGCWHVNKKGCAVFTITGHAPFITSFQKELIEHCQLKQTKLSNHGPKCASLYYGGNKQCKKIYNYLYRDASIFMDRKKLKVSGLFPE